MIYTLPHNGTRTSRASAKSAAVRAPTQMATVLAAIHAAGPHGMTRPELCAALGILGDSINPRVSMLIKTGRIHKTNRARKTRTGHDAEVLVHHEWYTLADEIADDIVIGWATASTPIASSDTDEIEAIS